MTRLLALLCLLSLSTASGGTPPPTPPSELCGPSATDETFCVPSDRFARWIEDERLEVVDHERTAKGVSGARRLRLRAGDGTVFDAKWKPLPPGLQVFNNAPRKELAAQAIAELVLPPGRHVVPPTEVVCLPPERGLGGRLRGIDCAAGLLSFWLHNVDDGPYFDPERWEGDPAFRQAMADFNLLTYLVDHRDSRNANFLRSTDPAHPRILSIDNGLAFSGFRNTLGFFQFVRFPYEADYRHIHVPALPVEHIERLAALTREDLDRLAVVRQFEVRGGELVQVEPTAPMRPKCGRAYRDGVIQLGLTEKEIDALAERVTQLVQWARSGALETY